MLWVIKIKGVLLCAGNGSRLNPMTRYMNKHLLPIYDKPMIDHCLEKLLEVGIKDIAIVSDAKGLKQIQEHLGTNAYTYIEQDYSKGMGIAKAIQHAQEFVGNDNFIVHLGDQYYHMTLHDFKHCFENSGKDAYLLLKETGDQARYHTVIYTKGADITDVVEKPDVTEGKTMIGVYAFTPKIFDYLKGVGISERNEYELADAVKQMSREKKVGYDNVNGIWIDAGTHDNLYKANKSEYERRSK